MIALQSLNDRKVYLLNSSIVSDQLKFKASWILFYCLAIKILEL